MLPCFIASPVLNAKCVDLDQMPYSVASDLGLHFCQCPFCGTLGIDGLKRTEQNCSRHFSAFFLLLLLLFFHRK